MPIIPIFRLKQKKNKKNSDKTYLELLFFLKTLNPMKQKCNTQRVYMQFVLPNYINIRIFVLKNNLRNIFWESLDFFHKKMEICIFD